MDNIEFDPKEEIDLHKLLLEKIPHNNKPDESTTVLNIIFPDSEYGLDTFKANRTRKVEAFLLNPNKISQEENR